MATYAIGDVQGCYRTLRRLLDQLKFDPVCDRLWLVGDLVNRGPRSLDVLRWAVSLGDSLTAVLGNHELHLLAIDAGLRKPRKKDTLRPILDAPDRAKLMDWVRALPAAHVTDAFVLTHAGWPPEWTLEELQTAARVVEDAVRADALEDLVDGNPPAWNPALSIRAHRAAAAAGLTRMRYVHADGRWDFACKLPPSEAPHLQPWFRAPHQRDREVLFGHWAALGLRFEAGVHGLDSGCVWGHHLTALRLDDRALFQVPYSDGDA